MPQEMISAESFRLIFLLLFCAEFVIERWLSHLNIRNVLKHKSDVPELLKGAIDPETHIRSGEYTLTRARWGHFTSIVAAVILLTLLFSGLLPWLRDSTTFFESAPIANGVLFILSLMVIQSLLRLPIEWHETFSIEARFGFNKMTPATFWLDRLKGLFLLVLLGGPFFYGLLWFVSDASPGWWVWAALFVIFFQLALLVLFPLVIAPLFNKFTPLEDGELKSRLETLALRCGFKAKGIFLMDGSKRSSHSNAYFTGFGKARRIVLFDTLVAQLSVPQLVAVLAHEIGHFKMKHILRMVLLSSVLIFMGFYFASILLPWPGLHESFFISKSDTATGLVILMLISGPMTFWLAPLFNALSRKHEYEADAFAVRETGDPDGMEGALLRLGEKNLSNLTPHPWYSAYHYSHPTLLERIRAIRLTSNSADTLG
jgi:STE24 endopeptidase